MKSAKANLILHPVRLRVLQTLLGGVRLTTGQIAAAMPDVAIATLYRHIEKLAKAGILTVVAEHPIRGTVEKVYALQEVRANLSPADLTDVSREDHLQYFTIFAASLLGDYARYLERDEIDLLDDGVGYRQAAMYLNDEEFQEMVAELQGVLQRFLALKPRPDRRRRLLSTILMPVEEPMPPVREDVDP
ncbi:MAG: helix-turn-helix domain-containing protein [Cyanobacteriota bacterium]|nr:helix-turn-helix domain-containing protein [Cyanobacteriota bacterium]